ncbi:tetraacyldisaccharide 4'-kinase [Advenella sp. RU8]|uniref:tetraacyldisaccharide 4'-kinase n=1 Tax=Advenella sp. RU8 TaxID=3399575 RepID=UPI003AABD39D
MKKSHTGAFARNLQQQWHQGGLLSTLLTPVSWLVYLVVATKSCLYRKKLKTAYRAPCPVIIVGNIYVGGTGKTPLVIALVQALRKKGFTPGVISRGYGVEIGPEARTAYGEGSSASQIGDEPSLIAKHAPVSVHPKRQLAIEKLLATWPATDVIISDDGLQHLKLQRDIEIVVQDNRRTGNGKLLPAGPLREPAYRLKQVDFIITNLKSTPLNRFQAEFKHEIAMTLEPVSLTHIASGQTLSPREFISKYKNQHIAAIAGIGQPDRFFATLAQLQLTLSQQIPFPDHYAYKANDIKEINADIILMTSKDASKCSTLTDSRLWFVNVEPRFSNPHFFDLIEEKIRQLPLYSSN